MATAEIMAGICGFQTTVKAEMKGENVTLSIESDCDAIERLAEDLKEVEPFREIMFRGEGPRTLELAVKHCKHTACPVPAGIIKAIEIASGMALPKDVTIRLTK